MMILRFEQVQRQGGHERAGQKIGREHGEHHRLGERYEEVARHAAQKEHRQEHDANAERRHEGGHGNLRRAVQDGLPHVLALFQIAIGVLDLDGRVIHEHAHREGEPAKRHNIDGLPEEAEGDEGDQNRQWNGHRNDQRAAPAGQKNQDHHAREAGGDDGFADHPAHRGAHEERLIRQRLDFELRREGRRHPWKQLADAFDDVECGGTSRLEHSQEHAAQAIVPHNIGLRREAIAHMGHVPKINR
jgi:hypothetical protein